MKGVHQQDYVPPPDDPHFRFNTGGSGSDYQTMKSIVAAGVNDHGVHKTDDLGHYRYQNMNFGVPDPDRHYERKRLPDHNL